MSAILRVHAIFRPLQGESTRAGLPCVFVRLAGCPLGCAYCDTPEARESEGRELSVDRVVDAVIGLDTALVAVTGGEPLAQPATPVLLTALCDRDRGVTLETSGAFSIAGLDARVGVIMDVKVPGSGMDDRLLSENLDVLVPGRDEVKFVVTSRADFEWSVAFCRSGRLPEGLELLVSPAFGQVPLDLLAGWILDSGLPLRLQPQLHKIIWTEGEGER